MIRHALGRITGRARRAAWRWMIFRLRDLLWRADEWIHAEEVKIRESRP